MHYRVSGLQLRTNWPLDYVPECEAASPVDVHIRLGETLPGLSQLVARQQVWYVSSQLDDHSRPSLIISTLAKGLYFRLAFADGTEFVIDEQGTQVWGNWSNAVSASDRTSFLLELVLSFVLSLRGVVSLHASAISFKDRAVAFVGPEEAGKSTLATAFAMRGCPVIADDLVALTRSDQTFLAQPGYPCLRLRSSAMSALKAGNVALPTLLLTEDGRYLDLHLSVDDSEFEQRPLPLAAIYFLTGPEDDATETHVEPDASSDALIDLIANTWGTRALSPSMRAAAFETLSQLSAQVSLRRVRHASARLYPMELCDIILNDLQSSNGETAARFA